jgi:hypothetical protein
MIDMDSQNQPRPLAPLLRQQHEGFDLDLLRPEPGLLYHLTGPGRAGKSMRPVAEHWVAEALVHGETVHWVDGACRIDPARLLPTLASLGADTEACLSRLYLSRGFTLHQLDRQLERLPHELEITRSPLLVVDGLLAMHEDEAIKRLESRTLLRRHIALLSRLAQHHRAAVVVITEAHGRTVHQRRLLQQVHRHAHHHLVGHWRGTRRKRTLYLNHPRSGLRGLWNANHDPRQTRFTLAPREFEGRSVPASARSHALQNEG